MDQDLVRALRARGVDVTTALEAGMIEREDREHLDYATAQDRVLYTFNIGDFYRLHRIYLAEGKFHAGMILGPQQNVSQELHLQRAMAGKALRGQTDRAGSSRGRGPVSGRDGVRPLFLTRVIRN